MRFQIWRQGSIINQTNRATEMVQLSRELSEGGHDVFVFMIGRTCNQDEFVARWRDGREVA